MKNCNFCHRFCNKISLTEHYRFWRCKKCNVEFRPNNVVNIWFQYNNDIYIYQERGHAHSRFLKSNTGEIFKFKTKPNINPSNVLDKFKCYMVFS